MAKSHKPARKREKAHQSSGRVPAKGKRRVEKDYVPFESDPEQSVDSDPENEKLRQKALREAELKKEDDRTRHADYVTRIRDGTADAEVIENYRATRKKVNANHYKKKKEAAQRMQKKLEAAEKRNRGLVETQKQVASL